MRVLVDGDPTVARTAFEQAGMELRGDREVMVIGVEDTPVLTTAAGTVHSIARTHADGA